MRKLLICLSLGLLSVVAPTGCVAPSGPKCACASGACQAGKSCGCQCASSPVPSDNGKPASPPAFKPSTPPPEKARSARAPAEPYVPVRLITWAERAPLPRGPAEEQPAPVRKVEGPPPVQKAERQAPVRVVRADVPVAPPPVVPPVTVPPVEPKATVEVAIARQNPAPSLSGQLETFGRTLRLRYAAVDQIDPYGGVVILDGNIDSSRLRDGQRLRVAGELIPPTTRNGSAHYRVSSIQMLD